MLKFTTPFYAKFLSNKNKIGGWQTKLIFKLLNNIKRGQLKLTTPEGLVFNFIGSDNSEIIKADLILNDWDALLITFSKGDVGFGEAFMKHQWSSSNLTNLLEFVSLNAKELNKIIHGKRLLLIFEWISHRLKFNSKKNSKSNIRAHYDLNNEFYKLFLDPSMTYSSAFYGANAKLGLQDAQKNKLHQIINLFKDFKEEFSVLEIGCGWGSFAKELIENTSAKYQGITLSDNQYEYNKSIFNIEEKKRVKFEILDYRNIVGKFDLIVSIEMFEAVGELYWSTFFTTLKRHLNPKGKAVVQTILISENKFEKYKNGVDFIQTYIFPGGMLASESIFKKEVEKAELNVSNELWFNKDYARTLYEWQVLFEKNIHKIEKLGLDQKFCNMWRFYLAYCEAGFKSGDLEVVQFTLEN